MKTFMPVRGYKVDSILFCFNLATIAWSLGFEILYLIAKNFGIWTFILKSFVLLVYQTQRTFFHINFVLMVCFVGFVCSIKSKEKVQNQSDYICILNLNMSG